jgi:hypothetical protein
MKEVMKKLPEKKRKLLRDVLARYLDHNPALRLNERELKRNAQARIDQFVNESVDKR